MKKKIAALFIALTLVISLASCGTENADKLTCTLSINCSTILDNMDMLDESKADYVPDDGVILYCPDFVFSEGESAYDILVRAAKENKLHMEAEAAGTSSAYVEGINNIYAMDCGDLSGWLFKVNDEFASVGCSEYILSDGDKVEFAYTCDMGYDLGADW